MPTTGNPSAPTDIEPRPGQRWCRPGDDIPWQVLELGGPDMLVFARKEEPGCDLQGAFRLYYARQVWDALPTGSRGPGWYLAST